MSAVLLGFIAHSFVAVNRYHVTLVRRYDGAARPGSTPATDDPAALDAALQALLHDRATPQLRTFSYMAAGEYLLSHLLVHLAVASMASLLVVVVATAFIVNLGGISGLTAYLLVAFRLWVWKALRDWWPALLARVVVPLFALVGVDVLAVTEVVWGALLRATLCVQVLDGPLVLGPRVFLNADAVLTATLGSALGVVDGFTRIIVSAVWGLLRCAQLHVPVVPPGAASLDRPYMAFGAMLRAAHVAQLQRAGGGFGFGGKTLRGADGDDGYDDDDSGSEAAGKAPEAP